MVDAIAIHRRADAEMIPVRRVDHVFVFASRVCAFELRDNVP